MILGEYPVKINNILTLRKSYFFTESTVGAAADLPVWLVSEDAAPAALECAEFEVSAGPELPWLALESRVAPPVLWVAPSQAVNSVANARAIIKRNFFMMQSLF